LYSTSIQGKGRKYGKADPGGKYFPFLENLRRGSTYNSKLPETGARKRKVDSNYASRDYDFGKEFVAAG